MMLEEMESSAEGQQKRSSLVFVVPIIVLVLLLGVFAYSIARPPTPTTTIQGSLFVSDAGRSHGGFEYTAGWNASLVLSGNAGTLSLVLNIGLGDALTQHEFSVTNVSRNLTTILMNIDGHPVSMLLVKSDLIWNHTYDNCYIASWGSDAPPGEIIGAISPTFFPGLNGQWYVELRLH